MRHRRKRCACFNSLLRLRDEGLLDGERLGGSSLRVAEITARELRPEASAPVQVPSSGEGSKKESPAQQEDGRNAELFQDVLRLLEAFSENEVMSEAGSEVGEEEVCPPTPAHPKGNLPLDHLRDVLCRLRLRQLPDVDVAMRLSQQVRDHLRDHCSTLVEMQAPLRRLIIVGDLHGHLNDLLHVLDANGEPSPTNMYLFNGDFVDRGHWGVELLFTLFCLKLVFPDEVHLNRGNHESIICNERYGFKSQLRSAYPGRDEDLYMAIQEAFRELPLCHVIGSKIFVVHGGLPMEDVSLDEIDAIPRGPVVIPPRSREEFIVAGLLWSDPADVTGPSHRGAGCRFDEHITNRFLESNGLRCIVRSHECVQNGCREDHSGHVLTIFSASNYNNVDDGNNANVVMVDSDLNLNKGRDWNEPLVHSSSSWRGNTEAEELVMARLRSMQAALPAVCSPRERCLGELRRMIFLIRPQLLQAFEAVDLNHVGLVTPTSWAAVMATCLRTPTEFPWLELGPHLYRLNVNGLVRYIDFLFRFDNPFSRWLADQWSRATLSEMSMRLGDSAAEKFNCLDTCKGRRGSQTGLLSYGEFRPLIQQYLPTTEQEAIREAVRVLTLFRAMDKDRSGFVSRHEFLAALDASTSQIRCPRKHRFAMVQPNWIQKFQYSWECDRCHMEIPRGHARLHCAECDYDLCDLCGGNRPEVQKQWDNIEDAIRLLCRSNCDVRSLIPHVDINGDGYVYKTEFVECLEALLQGNTGAAESVWELALGHSGQGPCFQDKMPVSYFEQCLAIIDEESLAT